MRHPWFTTGFFAVLGSWFACATTLPGSEPPLPNIFSKFGRKGDVIPGDQITAIVRGSHGFLWLGTQRGLIRFDGEAIRWYRHDPEDLTSLSSGDILVLFEDAQQRLLVGTTQGLNVLNRKTGKAQRVVFLDPKTDPGQGNPIWAITDDGQGGWWIGTDTHLIRWNPNSGRATARFDMPRGASALAMTQNNDLLIGTDGSGLFLKSQGSNRIRAVETIHTEQILKILPHPDGTLWVASTKGLFVSSASRPFVFETKSLPMPIDSDRDQPWVSDLALDGKQRIWAGTRTGLYLIDRDEISHYQHIPEQPQSLSGNRISCILADPEGMLWVSAQVNSLDQLNLNQEHMGRHRLDGNEVQSIHLAEDKTLWVGTKPNGLVAFDSGSSSSTWYLPQETVRQVMSLRNGTLLAATDRGLFAKAGDQTSFKAIWLEMRVWRILEHESSRVFLGTDNGLYEYLPNGEICQRLAAGETTQTTLARPLITALESDGTLGLWIGTYGGGLHHFNIENGTVRRFEKGQGNTDLLTDDVVDLFADRKGNLWIATLSGGLNIWNPQTGRMRRLGSKQGFPDDAVVSIFQDLQDTMWANTGVGLVSFQSDGSQVQIYAKREGNQSGAAVPGSWLYDDTRDRVYIGGSSGLVWFEAGSLPAALKPKMVFTSFQTKDGERRHMVLPGETLELRSEEGPFSVEYAILDFLRIRPYSYSYRREAVDGDWVDTQSKTPVTFTGNLKFGGRDRLWVRAKSDSRQVQQAELQLNIAAPTWLRWLPALIAAVLLLLAAVVYLVVSRFEKRKRLKLEEQARMAEAKRLIAEEKARLAEEREHIERDMRHRQETHALVLQEHLDQVSTEIANSLHDGPLSLLQGLRFKLRTVEPKSNESQKDLSKITDTLLPEINNRLRHLCGQMLKPQLTHGLITELTGIAQSLHSVHPEWELSTHFDPEIEGISRANQIKLVRIFRTLLNNVSKHAKATRVTCHLSMEHSQGHLAISDDGQGFTVPEDLTTFRETKHYGLYMVDYFATSMKGEFNISSTPGEGTIIDVRFPKVAQQGVSP